MEQLFYHWAGEECQSRMQMTANGSNRMYYRLKGETRSCIAAINMDVRENEAFFYFAEQLHGKGVKVPRLYAISVDRTMYLQEDLGDVTIYNYIQSRKTNGVDVLPYMRQWYTTAIDKLIEMQDKCSDIEYSCSYPRPSFDRQALMWDFNYFKYYFLKLFHIPFDEQLLERDFNLLCDYLLSDECNYFVHRDFQSRNIMVVGDELYFIDFQGARKGSQYYDVAALLYSSKSDLPDTLRKELLQHFLEKTTSRDSDVAGRTRMFYAYVLARIMQAMGAYGYRGVIEKKDYFIKSIPFAVNNLRKIIEDGYFPEGVSHLVEVMHSIVEMPEYKTEKEGLSVSVFSFSYRKEIPFDKSGNGGGFVFDCRLLPNPGLYEEYRTLNGRDKPVVDFFLNHPEVETYLDNVKKIVSQAIESYVKRGYTRLMLNFGCTGGRHRSVYCAEQIAKFIRQNYSCNVLLYHLEQGRL